MKTITMMIWRVIPVALLCLWGTRLPAQEERGASGVIASRDRVAIQVYREADLDTRAQLSGAGTVHMPLIGSVRIGGLTTDQAAKLIEGKVIPDRSLVMGTPGKVVRTLDESAVAGLERSAAGYVANGRRFREQLRERTA